MYDESVQVSVFQKIITMQPKVRKSAWTVAEAKRVETARSIASRPGGKTPTWTQTLQKLQDEGSVPPNRTVGSLKSFLSRKRRKADAADVEKLRNGRPKLPGSANIREEPNRATWPPVAAVRSGGLWATPGDQNRRPDETGNHQRRSQITNEWMSVSTVPTAPTMTLWQQSDDDHGVQLTRSDRGFPFHIGTAEPSMALPWDPNARPQASRWSGQTSMLPYGPYWASNSNRPPFTAAPVETSRTAHVSSFSCCYLARLTSHAVSNRRTNAQES